MTALNSPVIEENLWTSETILATRGLASVFAADTQGTFAYSTSYMKGKRGLRRAPMAPTFRSSFVCCGLCQDEQCYAHAVLKGPCVAFSLRGVVVLEVVLVVLLHDVFGNTLYAEDLDVEALPVHKRISTLFSVCA